MAQQVWRVRVRFVDAGTLQDLTSFGFHCEATGSDTTLSPDDVQDALNTFLNTAHSPGTNPIAADLANNISRATNAVTMDFTDVTAHLDGSSAGPPTTQRYLTLGAAREATNTSDRLAVAVAFRSDYGTAMEHGATAAIPSTDDAMDQGAPATHVGVVRPRARMRGRFYLGPFIFDCMDPTTGDPSSIILNDITGPASVFFGIHNEGLANQWSVVVHSKRDAAVYATSGGFFYVNEGWASQRRRGDTTENRRHNWLPVAV